MYQKKWNVKLKRYFYENGIVHCTTFITSTGQVSKGGNYEDKTDVLDCPENELESVDCVSICQPQLCPQTGNYHIFSAKPKQFY